LLKAAIFDLGGTLIHLDATWEQIREARMKAIGEALKAHGFALDLDQLKREYLRQHEEESEYATRTLEEIEIQQSFNNLFDRLGVEARQRPLNEELVKRFFAAEMESWMLFHGVADMLQNVRALKLKVGLLSNARNDWAVREIMNQLELTKFFDGILTSAAIGIRKPRPEPFRQILGLLRVQASEAVMIGNSMEADVAGAQPLGIRTIRVKFDDNVDEMPINLNVSVEPDITVSSVSEIVPAINRIATL
jgi:putative hydrolase of the HAD superfamily